MRLAALAVIALVAAGCGSYSSRSLERSLPRYPGAQFVSRDSRCGNGVCSTETVWRMARVTPEESVVAWYARHLPGWHYLDCGTGFTKGHAYVVVATSARTLDVYADAHGADHCNEVPAG